MTKRSEDKGPGYGRPPVSKRFKKKKSGNPNGRPKGRKRTLPYEVALGWTVKISTGGEEKEFTAAEAVLAHLAHQAKTDSTAASLLAEVLEGYQPSTAAGSRVLVLPVHAMGSPNNAARYIRAAKLLYPLEPHARVKLENWVVEAALARLGDQRLTLEEQREVEDATRFPHKMKWPKWWGKEAPQAKAPKSTMRNSQMENVSADPPPLAPAPTPPGAPVEQRLPPVPPAATATAVALPLETRRRAAEASVDACDTAPSVRPEAKPVPAPPPVRRSGLPANAMPITPAQSQASSPRLVRKPMVEPQRQDAILFHTPAPPARPPEDRPEAADDADET